MIGIYKITNPKGKVYIGCSTNIKKRWKVYKSLGCLNQPLLYNSLLEFGYKNHNFEILEECEKENLLKKEKFYIKKHNSFLNGLNQNKGGYGTVEHTLETKQKISEARKGWIPSKERGMKIGNKLKGRKHTEETKKKISKSNTGQTRSYKGRVSPNKGNSYSLEVRKKMSNLKKGFVYSEETKKKMSKNQWKKQPVYQFDLEGNFIKKWDCISDASKAVKGDVNSCLSGRQKKAGGFLWKRHFS